MSAPLVSIVIPAYNHARYLGEAIESVLLQDYPRIELIVIDDGSTDDTKAVLEKYQDRAICISQPNEGQVPTLTKGWDMANGEVLAFLSADDTLMPGAVRLAVTALADGRATLAYGDFDLVDEQSRRIRTVHTPDYDFDRMLVEVICPPGPGAFFRRSAYEATGSWDAGLRAMLDYDYWLRLGLQGPFVRVPEVLASYRVHRQSQTFAGYSEEQASEPVLIVSRFFEGATLGPGLMARKREALGNAHLVAAQLHMRAGRLKQGVNNLHKAWKLHYRNFLTIRFIRLAANVLLNRIGHRALFQFRRFLSCCGQ